MNTPKHKLKSSYATSSANLQLTALIMAPNAANPYILAATGCKYADLVSIQYYFVSLWRVDGSIVIKNSSNPIIRCIKLGVQNIMTIRLF
jgi:hypothetical protein